MPSKNQLILPQTNHYFPKIFSRPSTGRYQNALIKEGWIGQVNAFLQLLLLFFQETMLITPLIGKFGFWSFQKEAGKWDFPSDLFCKDAMVALQKMLY